MCRDGENRRTLADASNLRDSTGNTCSGRIHLRAPASSCGPGIPDSGSPSEKIVPDKTLVASEEILAAVIEMNTSFFSGLHDKFHQRVELLRGELHLGVTGSPA